jgi:hypothetical protein
LFISNSCLGGLCLLIYLSFAYLSLSKRNEQWVIHTYQVLLHVEKLKFRIQQLYPSIKNNERAGKPESRNVLRDKAAEALKELAALRQLTVDNPLIQKLLLNKQKILNDQIASSFSKSNLPVIATEYKLIERSELKLLNDRKQKAKQSETHFKLLIRITVAISSLAVLILLYGARQSITASDILIVEIETSKIAYELLFMRIGEVLFSRDSKDQTFLDISITCESMFGYSADNFINDKFLWFKIIHPEDRHQAISSRSKLEKGGIYIQPIQDLKTRWKHTLD